jgi:phospholipase C
MPLRRARAAIVAIVVIGATLVATPPSSGAQVVAAARPCGSATSTTYRHVIWIWMENRSYASVLGRNGDAPNLARYARQCGVATNYHAVAHPSLPNYIAAVSGGTRGANSDCAPGDCSLGARSLFGQVTRSRQRWSGYAESMSHNCDHASYGRYAARHNPAVYFTAIARQCRRRDVRLGGVDGPLARALRDRHLAAFSFVTPNLCHDGHDCATGVADRWLRGWLDRITGSRSYAAGHTAVFVTWDEGVGRGNHVATVVIAPTVPRGSRVATRFSHYSLLRTTEQMLGLPRLGKARTAAGMRSAFRL